MATATPQQCCLPAHTRPPPISAPLRLRYLTRGASCFHFPGRRTATARRGRTAFAFSPRCTLETAGPAFDPLGLYTEDPSRSDYQSPLSTFFGILSPVFGSSSGSRKEKSSYGRGAAAAMEDSTIDIGDFFKGPLPGKFLKLLGFLALSRLGVYIPLGGVNREAFAGNLDQNSLLGTLDSFSGGGIGRLGICSLGIVPFINAQIVFQLLAQLYPKLQDLQKKEGEAGRKKILQYTRYASVGFAIVQAIGQVLFLRPYVNDFSTEWVLTSVTLLTLGSVFTTFLGETISELKLGNGTSLLIFTSIISYLPASFGRTVAEGFQAGNYVGLLTIILSFFFLVLGIVYVQEAERKIPLNYASRYSSRTGGPQRSAYLPFKVNSSGVMPIIFSTSSLALPATLARFTGLDILKKAAIALTPGGSFYLPTNVMLIAFFNYYYTFLQLDPDDLSEQLKRQGASIPLVRPGKNTAAFIKTLGIVSAVQTLCGQAYGAQKLDMLGVYMQRSVVLLMATAVPLTAIYVYSHSILVLIGESPEIARAASVFVYGLIPQIFAYAVNFPIQNFMQAQSIMAPSAYITAATLAAHVALSYVVVYRLGLGLLGASLALSASSRNQTFV